MDAVQHAAMHILWHALHKGLVKSMVATVAQSGTIHILLVAVHRIVARGYPQDAALVGMGATRAQEAICLIIVTWIRVTTKHIRRTILRLAGTVLG